MLGRSRYGACMMGFAVAVALFVAGSAVYIYEEGRLEQATARVADLEARLAEADSPTLEPADRVPAADEATETTPPVAPTVPADPVKEDDPAGTFERRFCYVRGIQRKSGRVYVTVDYADFLVGEEAVRAAKANGDYREDYGGSMPDDYYVSNVNPKLRTFPVAENAAVTLCRPQDSSSFFAYTLDDFVDRWQNGLPLTSGEEPSMHWRRAGYWLTVYSGEVRDIQEQYVP